MDDRLSKKLYIPHPEEPNRSIVGILEQLSPRQSTQGRKIALVHFAWHNGVSKTAHKDYLFQRRLAVRLPLDSFRFDFRGNHETGGTWKQGALDKDIVDINTVVGFLKREYGYVIDLVVGHSRGALVAFRWLCTTEDGRNVTAFVNASGRYRMHAVKAWQESFAKQGYHVWEVSVARKQVTAMVTPEDLEAFVSWDTSLVWDHFPAMIDVLTLHGLSDKTVPPYDALIYARALSERTPGTHTLHLMEDADHNFTGRQDEVVDAILQWWEARRQGEIKTGIWQTGIRGKL
ncbi:ectomycorrhiza-regulated esterase [Crucibulum laeve]|uniref:Ectomycorrhiza-regulated esterase n=1 Tax=Crucibulum laeve TaxID=68775 RepID=A0A5C3M2V5_9AGAR|nr:ectomycorrhiza-regulated esterase [Crucibulum laeve]